MAGVLESRESELLGSELGAMHHVCEMEKERFAKQLLDGMGSRISGARPVKMRKPLKMRLREWFRRILGIERKEIERRLSEIERDMANYKIDK